MFTSTRSLASPAWIMALAVLGCVQAPCWAEAERVKFDTFDRVELRGLFYPSSQGSKAPCALLLHNMGGSSDQEGWAELAKKLQDKGFAVLAFDFRGHGESLTVAQDFWLLYPENRKLRSYRSSKLREQISYKDFPTSYWPTLVNDIVAAKLFLDRKNDTGECNSANIAVIGAESGATLGALWVWDAYKRKRLNPAFGIGAVARNETEGQDIVCAVWLSIVNGVGDKTKYTMPVDNWLKSPVREKVPMLFVYGEQDARAARYARTLVDNTLKPDRGEVKLKLTGKRGVKETKLAGRELLGKPSLNTEQLIIDYVTKVTEDKGKKAYVKRDADRQIPTQVPLHLYLRN